MVCVANDQMEFPEQARTFRAGDRPRAFVGGPDGDTRGVCSDASSECANTWRIREPSEPSVHTTRGHKPLGDVAKCPQDRQRVQVTERQAQLTSEELPPASEKT